MSTSPSGVSLCSYAVGTMAPAMMEDSSALTRRRGLVASSAIQAAVQSFFDGEETGFLTSFTAFVLWVSLERSWSSFLSVSAYKGYSFS